MQTLESKIGEAKTKKDMYIARARSAQASQRLNEMLGGVNTSGSLSAFERMEEKFCNWKPNRRRSLNWKRRSTKEIFLLESSNEIDTELAAMKAQLLSGSKQPSCGPDQSSATAKDPT